MKAIKKAIILCLGCIFLCTALLGCTTYDLDHTEDGWAIGWSKLKKNCFVGPYDWDGDLDNMDVTVPDNHKGFKITNLGGYFGRGVPTPFYINIPEDYDIEYMTFSHPENTPDWYPSGFEVINLTFNLTISANIKSIVRTSNGYFAHLDEDGSYTLYRVLYYVNCNEDNKTFYSKDGVLYRKSKDTRVDSFWYHEEAN